MYPQAYDRIRTEPEVLDADMTPADIAAILKRLKFYDRHCLIGLDRPTASSLPTSTRGRTGATFRRPSRR
jgi:hypothetical protein